MASFLSCYRRVVIQSKRPRRAFFFAAPFRQMDRRIGSVHVLGARDASERAGDIVRQALATTATQQTIVCVGAGAADAARALCHEIGHRCDSWRALCAIMDIACPGGAERVVFMLDAAGTVCGVQWDAPLPPYDAAPLLAAVRRVPYAGSGDDAADNVEQTQFLAHLSALGIDAALLWRAGDALDALSRDDVAGAAARLVLDARLIRPCVASLARLLHRRIIDWLAGHVRSPRCRPVRTLAVCVEPMSAEAASFDHLCRRVVSDMMHAALDAAFVAADRDERAADGCERGTAAPSRYSCDYAATTLRTALADAPDARALVAALGATLAVEHVRGRTVYDVAAWHAPNRNVDAGTAQQLLGASALSRLMQLPRTADRRGSAILLSPGRAPPSVFGARLDAMSALLDGTARLHWLCCNDADTVRRLRVLQRAAGPLHVRAPVAEFVARYACVAPRVPRRAEAILAATVGVDGSCAHVGPCQVWLTARAADCLDQLAAASRQRAATGVQAWWRGCRSRRMHGRVRRTPPPTPPSELAVLRAVVATAFAAEHAWERAHTDAAAPAYSGLVPALVAALTSARLAAVPCATSAVVLRLLRYAGWTPLAYDALGAAVLDVVRSGRATPAGAEAVAAVAAADARVDRGLALRLWLAMAPAAAQRLLAPERAALAGVVAGAHNDVARRLAATAWQRVCEAAGPTLAPVAGELADALLLGATHRPDAETAVLCAEWLSQQASLRAPRWRSALAVAMLPDWRVLQDAEVRAQVCPQLSGGELAALGAPVGRVAAAVAAVAVPAVAVDGLWALDVSFY